MTERSLFAAALDIADPAARAAFLDKACAADPALRRHLDELLATQGQLGSFLADPAPAPTGDYDPPIPEGEGTAIGPYRLMEQIGEGGFGLVFVAEQTAPVRRKVALKIIKPGMDTRQVVARFEAERQALALMDHPNIAKVLDAGATDSGRPFFVMELVKGVPITEYADTQHLTPRDRLGLFIQVCHAVQHAHQKGVIHRDLKPSNILVAPHDGIPVVKVIDFGVAKALGQSLTDKTIYTRFAQMIGTPLYMSPEQAEVNQLDVDTRSDIYSLGVLLYELLTGTTPFDRDRFRQAAFEEIRRIIKEEEPPRPSTRLTSLGETLTAVSAHRGTDPGKLAGLVRGELDWIVMRCLEKDRSRRYDSAAGLAKDVQRYLADEPVEARPASAWYRFRKLARRNKAALTTTAALLVLLVGGVVGTTLGMVRANQAAGDALDAKGTAVAESERAGRAADDLRAEQAKLRAEQDRTRRLLYASLLSGASAALADNRVPRMLQMLEEAAPKPGEPDLRGWEWHFLDRLTRTGHEYTLDSGRKEERPPGPRKTPGPGMNRGPVPSLQGRWIVNPRQTADGVVFDIHDAADGRRVGQVPKTGAIPPQDGALTRNPVLSADGRHLLLAPRPADFRAQKAQPPAPTRIWEVETGRTFDGPAFAPLSALASPNAVVLGPDAAWAAWLEHPAGSDPPTPIPSEGLPAPLKLAVGRWERATGLLPPKPLTVGRGAGYPFLGPDGRTVFWLPTAAVASRVVPPKAKVGLGEFERVLSGGGVRGPRNGAMISFECWDTTAGPNRRWAHSFPEADSARGGQSVPDAALSTDRTMVGLRGRGEITVYRVSDGQAHWSVPLAADDSGRFLVSDDGGRVVLCGEGTITVYARSAAARPDRWHVRYRPRQTEDGGPRSETFSLTPDGRTLIGLGGPTVRVWDVSRDPADNVPKTVGGLRQVTDADGTRWNERTSADGRVTIKSWRALPSAPKGLPPAPVPPVTVTVRGEAGREGGRFELPGGTHPTRVPGTALLDGDRRLLVRTCLAADEEPTAGPSLEWKGLGWALYDLTVPGKLPRLNGGTGHPWPVPNSPYLLNYNLRGSPGTTDRFEILDARTGRVVQTYTAAAPTRYYTSASMFSPTGERFIRHTTAGGSADGREPEAVTVEVLATATGERLWAADLGVAAARTAVHSRFSPDGRRVLIEYTTPEGTYLRSGTAADGGDPRTVELARGDARLAAFRSSSILDVTADGRRVAVRAVTAVDVWDLDAGERLLHLAGHDATVGLDAAFDGSGTRLFTKAQGRGTSERRLHVWDVATGRELLTLPTGATTSGTIGNLRYEDGRVYLSAPARVLDGRPVTDGPRPESP